MHREKRDRNDSHTRRSKCEQRKQESSSEESETEQTTETTDQSNYKISTSKQNKKREESSDDDRKYRAKSREKYGRKNDDNRKEKSKHRENSRLKHNESDEERHGRSKYRDKSRQKQVDECDCKYCTKGRKDTFAGRMIVISSPSVQAQNHLVSLTSDTSEIPERKEKVICHKPKKCSRKCSLSRKDDLAKQKSSNKHRAKSQSKTSNNKNKQCEVKTPCCPLCTKTFECPVLLSCAHTFCKDCVTILVEASDGKSFKCPVCMTRMPLTGSEEELFCPNFMVLRMVDKSTDEGCFCSACDYENEAGYYCDNCTDLLCRNCKEAHKVVKYTKDHQIKRITSNLDLSRFSKKRYFCSEHISEQLVIRCTKCKKNVCRECALRYHNGDEHNCIPIHDAAEISRETMQRTLFNVKGRTPTFQLTLMDIKRVKKLLRNQVQIVKTEVTESVKRLTTALKDRERSLFLKVDQVYKSKMSRLNNQKENVLIELEQFEAVSRLLQQLEHHDNNVEMLQMKTTIEKCLKGLEKTSSAVKIEKDSFLLKSNEIVIKKNIARHGEIFRVGESLERKLEKPCDKKLAPANSTKTKDDTNVILFSNFEDSLVPNPKDEVKANNYFLKSTIAGSKAKSLRIKANWLVVRSRVFDIIKYGRIYGLVNSRPNKIDPSEVFMNRIRRAKARKLKAQSNWLVVQARLKDIALCKLPPKIAMPRKHWKQKVSKQWNTVMQNKAKRKAKRIEAIKLRARANWLLIRSKLNDITDYGRITGVLTFNPKKGSWNSVSRKKRESATILKLKHYRAITLRARANWLLVFSRLKDIVEFPKRKQNSTNKLTWSMYRENLLTSRDKATRNKIIAGEIRARANWMIVKTRLPDVILYGMYQQYTALKDQEPSQLTRCTSPYPKKSPIKRSRSHSPIKTFKSAGTLKSPLVERPPSASPNRRNQSFKYWDILSQGSSLPHDKIRLSPSKKQAGFNKKEAYKNWDKLILPSIDTLSKTTRHNSQKRSRSQSPVKAYKKDDNRKPISRSSSQTSINNEPECNWKKVIGGKMTRDNSKSYKAENNWHVLIAGTESFNKKEKTAENNWSKLIAGTLIGSSKSSQLDKEAYGNWATLISETSTDRLKSNRSNAIAEGNWNQLINGTTAYRSKPDRSRDETENNWIKLITGCSSESEAELKWEQLISGTKTDSKLEINKDGQTKSRSKVKNKDLINSNWDVLIRGTPSAKASQERFPSVISGMAIKARAHKNWNTVKNSLGKGQKKHGLTNTGKQIALNNWRALAKSLESVNSNKAKTKQLEYRDDLKIKRSSSNHSVNKSKNNSFKNWDTLIAGTDVVDNAACMNWRTLIQGMMEDGDVDKDNAYLHWMNLAHGSSSQNLNEDETLSNCAHLTKDNQDTLFGNEDALFHWDKLVEGKIVRQKDGKEEQKLSRHPVPSPAPSRTSKTSHVSTKSAVVRNWQKLLSRTPSLTRSRKSTNVVKVKEETLQKWDALVSGTDTGSKEDISYDNWNMLIDGRNEYKIYDSKQPKGVKKLYEKLPTVSYEDENRVLDLKVKNSKGHFHNVQMKLSSPDKSILSAHIAENNDGTFTIFCCPRIDNDFNMFVSLAGSQFKHEIKVLNFYGSFAGLRKQEANLACKTISLLRWHLTPGLLTKKGDKIIARKENKTPSVK